MKYFHLRQAGSEGRLAVADIKAQCPAVSVPLIRKILADMKASHKVRLSGRGRSARWETVRR